MKNIVFYILSIKVVFTNGFVLLGKKKYQNLTNEKCFEGLGCVSLTPEWTDQKYRPVNVLPSDRHAVNTIFVRWSLDGSGNVTPDILGTADLKYSGLKRFGSLKMLIHDFTSNGYTGWIKHLSRALLTHPGLVNMNIVSVDWAAGAEPPYVQAVANARLVALEIIHFLDKINWLPAVSSKRMHFIGHGLGAHIAGYVGKMRTLPKITALDPSGPYFANMPPNVRLCKDDANLVEVIHSDATSNGQGSGELLGHVDYYPNGGRDQPGCLDTHTKLTALKRDDLELGQILSACSHKRSLKYYIEALVNPSCKFLGVACASYKDFIKGKCTHCGEKKQHCSVLHPLQRPRSVNNTNGFYFVTSSSSPFCGELLMVDLVLKSKKDDQAYVKGYFNVTVLQPKNGDVSFLLNENHAISALETNVHNPFLVFRATPPPLQLPARAVHLRWHHAPLQCSWATQPKISSLFICKITDQQDKIQWFCPVTGGSDEPLNIGLEPCVAQKYVKTTTELLTTSNDYYVVK